VSKDTKTETVIFAMDKDQAWTVIQGLQKAVQLGGKTIFLMSSNKPEILAQFQSKVRPGDIAITEIDQTWPSPDVVIHHTIYLMSFENPIDEILEILERWSDG
jgi:hypothetical protein